MRKGLRKVLPVFVCFTVIQAFASAQTIKGEKVVSVLFMTFSGFNTADAAKLGSAMYMELEWISRTSGYTIRQSTNTLKTPPAFDRLSAADQMGNPKYLINGVISQEGEISIVDVSLWTLEDSPALVFSEIFDYRRLDDALSMVPFYSWSLYSVLPVLDTVPDMSKAARAEENTTVVKDSSEEEEIPAVSVEAATQVWQSRWLSLGLRAGISPRFYNFEFGFPKDLGFTWEAAFQAEFQFLQVPWGQRNVFLGVQGEAIFTVDMFNLPDVEGNASDMALLSIMVPLLVKLNYKPGPFALSLYGGMYYIGYLSAAAENSTPWGYSMGFKFGVKAGKRGTAFFDLRYSSDLGLTDIESSLPVSYRRYIPSLALGYGVGLFDRK